MTGCTHCRHLRHSGPLLHPWKKSKTIKLQPTLRETRRRWFCIKPDQTPGVHSTVKQDSWVDMYQRSLFMGLKGGQCKILRGETERERERERPPYQNGSSSDNRWPCRANEAKSKITAIHLLFRLTGDSQGVCRQQRCPQCSSLEHRPLTTDHQTSTAALPIRQHSHSPDVLCLKSK